MEFAPLAPEGPPALMAFRLREAAAVYGAGELGAPVLGELRTGALVGYGDGHDGYWQLVYGRGWSGWVEKCHLVGPFVLIDDRPLSSL